VQRLSDPPRIAPEIGLQSHDDNADIGIIVSMPTSGLCRILF
jgi:hypothetical protein